jgi:hypothetical protein
MKHLLPIIGLSVLVGILFLAFQPTHAEVKAADQSYPGRYQVVRTLKNDIRDIMEPTVLLDTQTGRTWTFQIHSDQGADGHMKIKAFYWSEMERIDLKN